MFRKPKKSTKKTSFRAVKRRDKDSDGVPDGSGAASAFSRKAYRKRSDGGGSSSDSDVGGGQETTSDLINQVRRERNGGKKRPRDDGGAGDGRGLMHEFRATDDRLTAKELATRTAEHHPSDAAISRAGESEDGKMRDGRPPRDDGEATATKEYKGSAQPRNKFLAGPLKAPTFVRTTCRFDYQPDICKDYKDTGFCGFGDTCIYLHDRGDTMTGWQLEQQWEERKKAEADRKEREMERFLRSAEEGTGGGKDGGAEGGKEDDSEAIGAKDDGLPFACHVCRQPFKDPVVTPCGHYFCEKCILNRIRGGDRGEVTAAATSECPICGKDTHGVLNHPTKLVAKRRRLVGRDGTWEEFAEEAKKVKAGG